MRHLTKETLGMTESHAISDDQGFFDLGIDSLMAIEFRNTLQAAMGTSFLLPTTLIFDRPTINALADYLKTVLLPEEKEIVENELAETSIEREMKKEITKKEKEIAGMNVEELNKLIERI